MFVVYLSPIKLLSIYYPIYNVIVKLLIITIFINIDISELSINLDLNK